MNDRSARRAALNDIRVVECGTGVSAPFCARILADLGAEVIKVEPPGGDPSRSYGPFPADRPHPERSALFAYCNAGKRSVLLDGEDWARQELLERLAASADVLVTNLSAAERARWNLDIEAIAAANPGLITVALSELGESGLLSRYRAYEINVCALAAASIILGEPGRPPLHFPFHLPALEAGLHGAGAALAALLARRRGGGGQSIEIAEADVLAYCAGGMSLYILGLGGNWRRRGLVRRGAIYPTGFYPCKDGFIYIATQTRAQWKGFLQLMGNPDWAQEDAALQDGVAIARKRADEVDEHFVPWLMKHTRRELTQMARQADLVLGPINSAEELLTEPHLDARGFWTEIDLDGTPLRLPGMGYKMSRTPWRIGRPPMLGEHTATALGTPARPAQRTVSVEPRPRQALAGYRAIDFGWNWAGPMVGQILADLGMEVIKIETRQRLDFMRHWKHAQPFFRNTNRGKLSVSVNIKKPGGVELVRRLATRVDLVLDNFAAGVMARNGLDYERLREVKPDIIVLSMAMAGQNGPLEFLRGLATVGTGYAGLESAVGYPDTGPTGFQLLGLGDNNASIQGVVAFLAALWHREQTGEGQFIDLSQIEAAATLVGEPLGDFQLTGRGAGTRGNYHPRMAPHGTYPAAGEDRWVALAVGTDGEWQALVRAMGRPAWAADESLRTAAGRRERRAELDTNLAAWTVQFPRDELVEQLQEAGVAAAPVLEIAELNSHPHFLERGLSHQIERSDGEPELVYNTPWHCTVTPPKVRRRTPEVGEHNEYVFGELLGMSAGEIRELVEQEVMC